jgi:hypothetical protein
MRETAMDRRLKYRRKSGQFVVAVRLDLDTNGLSYHKWGGRQRAKRGDWLVDNNGEVYTVDGKVFARTYRRIRPGCYVKKTPVWAEVAAEAGSMKTKEGASRYRKGDYLVYNHRNGRDGYCMSPATFKARYVRDARRGR